TKRPPGRTPMTITRRDLVAGAGLGLALLPGRALAAFPERAIHMIVPFVQAHLGYDPLKDFAAVALTSYVPHVLIMSNKVEAKTVADLIALSKKAPITIATSGIGSARHMTLERLKSATGAAITHVPYRGGGSLLPHVVGGSVNGALTELSTALPLHKGRQARIL